MNCPDCGAEVDAEQDFCLECGEPIAGAKPKAAAAVPARVPAPKPTPNLPPNDLRVTTLPETKAAKTAAARRRSEEPEPERCPGCGMKTTKERCPSCGTRLRPAEE
jgi:predicted amidophosphoribosyltransferase